MIRQSIARRYARGLFASWGEGRAIQGISAISSMSFCRLSKGAEIERALMLPLLEMDKRKELLSDIIKALSMDSAPAALLGLLLERNRMNYLPSICDAYEEMVNDKEGLRARGRVLRLSHVGEREEPTRRGPGARLSKRVQLDMREDKSLIGGIKVIVGGLRIDGSVKRQLELLNESMMKE